MITVHDLHHHIGSKAILQHINLELAPGRIIALIGPNGAGKSTLLAHIARLTPIQRGQIQVDTLDIATSDSHHIARKLAILQQQTRFMSRLTIEELLTFARYPYHRGRPRSHDRDIIENTLAYFDLGKLRHTYIDALSGGQRQRALVAMTFAQDTDYILLDEPLNNLDMHYARNLMANLRQAVDDYGKTIVVVLHDINYAAHYADHVVAMQHGRIRHSGATNEVLSGANISALYDMDVEMLSHDGKRVCLYF